MRRLLSGMIGHGVTTGSDTPQRRRHQFALELVEINIHYLYSSTKSFRRQLNTVPVRIWK